MSGPKSLFVTAGSTTLVASLLSYGTDAGASVYFVYVISMLIQSIVFITHASGLLFGNAPSEKYYDLTGSSTFVIVTLFSLFYNSNSINPRKIVLSFAVLIWATRLGHFLFSRICHEGGIDSRFVEVKKNLFTFGTFWLIQGLWVFLTSFPVQLVLSLPSAKSEENFPTLLDSIGIAIWVFGFAFEVIADLQKHRWKENKITANQFINTGLWKISRHPNYFGEITLWVGVFLVSSGAFTSARQYLSAISPLFTAVLLIFVSGIPLLEKSADKKWGENTEYLLYKKRTAVLVPFF